MTLEEDVRRLNDADKGIKAAIRVYMDVGWSWEEFQDRVEEMAEEEGMEIDSPL